LHGEEVSQNLAKNASIKTNPIERILTVIGSIKYNQLAPQTMNIASTNYIM